MYKVVFDDIVIDVFKKINYMRYLTKAKRFVLTDKSSANCIRSSNGKEYYYIDGMRLPVGIELKTVKLVEISEKEYTILYDLLLAGNNVCDNEDILRSTKEVKIREMSEECHKTIINGVSVLFSDNEYHHFELTIEDQINLMNIESQIKSGIKEFLYHEKGKSCQFYSAIDIKMLINAVNRHKLYHTTYFNLLKQYINTLYDVDRIKNIHYGIDLPKVYTDKLDRLLENF